LRFWNRRAPAALAIVEFMSEFERSVERRSPSARLRAPAALAVPEITVTPIRTSLHERGMM